MTEEELRKVAGYMVDALVERLSERQPEPTATVSSEPRWMNVTQYAKRSGFSRSTLYKYIRQGLPGAEAQGGFRVDVRAADKWISQGYSKEIAAE